MYKAKSKGGIGPKLIWNEGFNVTFTSTDEYLSFTLIDDDCLDGETIGDS
jgi:hypothetical protein